MSKESFVEPDFKTLFEQAPGLYMILDPNLRIVAASDAYLEATLTRRPEIIGRYVFDVFPEYPKDDASADEVVPKSLASFNRVLRTRMADTMGLQRHDVRKSESEGGGFEVRYWSAVNSPVFNPDGSLAYIFHRVENVTEYVLLKQQGAEQAQSTEELREQAVRMEADIYARSREVAESSLKLKQANDELTRHHEHLEELVKERTGRLEAANEQLLSEIAGRKQAEEELRENQSKLDLAPRSAEMGVWHLDVAENKHVFDDQVCRLLGIEASKFSGAAEEFFDAVHPDDREKLRTALVRTVEHGAPYETEYRAVWPNGSIHHITARGRLLCDDKGRPFRVNGLIWDMTERKRAEERLRTTVQRFNNILSNVLYGILLVGEDDRVEFANQYFCDQFGFAECPSDLIGMRAKEMIQKVLSAYADPEVNVARVHQIVTQGNRVRGEEVTMRDGQVLLRDFVPLTVDGKPSGRMWHHRDITERKRMEEELRKSRNELELRVKERTAELLKASEELREKAEIIDFAHDAILARDIDDRIVFWSKGAEETYGFRKEETLGQISHEFLKTAFPLPLETVLEVVLQKGEWRGELKHTKANGERIVVDSRWAVQFGLDGKPEGFLEVNRDITARKIAEEEFRKADRALRTLSEFNQAMVRQTDEMELLRQVCRIVADVGGYRLVWVGFAKNDENKSVVPIVSAGYDYGYLAQARITWADNERGQGPCGISIRTGKMSVSQNAESNPSFAPWRFEAAKRGITSSISLPLIVEGHVIGALGIYASEPDAFDEGESSLLSNLAENLSYGIASIRLAEQRRKSQEELKVYASRLEMINKELQDFAFVAAHDLQEPLRKIQTFCDLAIQRCTAVLDNTSKDYLDRVIISASRMRELLHELLEFSMVAAIPEPFDKIDLVRIAREAADVFEALVEETGCRIEIENMPAIEADESQMLRLFQNLIGNALKFRSDETPHIKIYGKSDRKGTWEIFVKDNGIGFEQQYVERIFKPFQKLHRRGEYAGVGMGLAVCRKIVEQHSGTIRAESEPGKGSTFIIRMPAKQMRPESVIV
jgi:PAS domain S-box-containing protein